jgi:hypothetical protein
MTLSGNAVVKASFGRDHKVKTTAMQLAPELVDFDCIGMYDFSHPNLLTRSSNLG